MNIILVFIFIILFLYMRIKKKKNYKKSLIISLSVTIIIWFLCEIFNYNDKTNISIITITSEEYVSTKKLPNIFVEIEDFTL